MGILANIIAPRAEVSTLSRPEQWLIDLLGGDETLSGERVNSKTALGIITYFACVRNIAEDVGKLPRALYRHKKRGKEKVANDPRYRLLHDAPNPEMSSMSFHETLTGHALGFKGGFAEIERAGNGMPAALWPLDPCTVEPMRTETDRRLVYRVTAGGVMDILEQRDMLHVHGLGYDGVTQYILWCIARESLGGIMAARNFGSAFFGRGTTTTGLLEIPSGFQPKQLQNLRDSWAERHEGKADKAHKTILLEAGVTYKAISTEPQKSQMLETLEFGVEEVCRLFRMPPQKVGHLARAVGWSTVEQFNIDYVTDCLTAWLERWEQEYNRKLFSPRESDMFVEHSVEGLLRGDSEKRSAFYGKMLELGAMSPNDIRDKENMNPVANGDTYFVSNNVQTLKNALKPPVESKTSPGAPPNEPDEPDEPQDGLKLVLALAHGHEALLADAFARVMRVEATKVRQAAKKGALDELRGSFYADHMQHLAGTVAGTISAFMDAAFGVLNGELPDEVAEKAILEHTKAIADRQLDRSLSEMRDDAKVEQWSNGVRATEVATEEMRGLVELVMKLTKGAQ
jgi:HK97 family phage portal protein